MAPVQSGACNFLKWQPFDPCCPMNLSLKGIEAEVNWNIGNLTPFASHRKFLKCLLEFESICSYISGSPPLCADHLEVYMPL